MAYGFLDETKRKHVIRALSTGNDPYIRHFAVVIATLNCDVRRPGKTRWKLPQAVIRLSQAAC